MAVIQDDGSEFSVTFEHEFSMIRILDDLLIPSFIKMKVDVLPLSSELDDVDLEVYFSKIRYWIDNVVSRAIIFTRDNDTALDMMFDDDGYSASNNILMLTPEDPGDIHLGALFAAKMFALANENLMFVDIEIKSNLTPGLSFTFNGEPEDVLPEMKEWIGERTYFEKPWWNRDDASTLDVVPKADADLTELPKWAYDLDFIEKTIRPKQEKIIKPEFKPTVIKGGKDE